MAKPKVTSSRNRAARRPSSPRPVSTGSARGRQARARVSQANVTTGGSSGSGNARVTVGRGGAITPGSPRAERIRQAAAAQRPIGDSPRTRAGAAAGARAVAQAQARRGAQAASQAMTRRLGQAAAGRAAGAALRGGAQAALVGATLSARNTAKGTLDEARRRGDPVDRSGPGVPKRLTQAGVDKGNFDSAFAAASRAGKKTFTWNGKRYTTKRADD